MNDRQKRVIDGLVSSHGTNLPGDVIYQAELLKIYKKSGDIDAFEYLRTKFMQARKEWLYWYIDSQFKWNQVNRNRHHDSFEIREKYIGCHTNNIAEREFEKRAKEYNKIRKPDLYIKHL